MIDMHVHTDCSDGTEDVIDVLKKAENIGLEYLAITDHNTCKAYDKLKDINIKEYYTGNLIKGLEINTIIDGMPIELLGYGVNYKIINDEIHKIYITKEQRNEIELKELIKNCKRIGISGSDTFLQEYDPKKYLYSSDYIHKKIVQNEENKKFFTSNESWENSLLFYRREMCNKDSAFYIDTSKITPSIDKVIELIKKAGGLVFVPHIYEYGDNSEKIFQSLVTKYKKDIDGFECYYSKFTKEQTDFLIEYCNKNNFYMSGGSDYHGKRKPNIYLGTGINNNLNINKDIIKLWLKEEYLYKEEY